MIQPERLKVLNRHEIQKGRYVLYWMQASQRATYNHALEFAIDEANHLGQPLIVYFGLTDNYPHANERHYRFMLEGLKETRASLGKRGIRMVVRHESPEKGVVGMAGQASEVVVDRGYTRVQKRWRAAAARALPCRLVQVESDVIVPLEVASGKEEYAAATLRPKIHRAWDDFLIPLEKRRIKRDSLGIRFSSFPVDDIDKALRALKIDRSVTAVSAHVGGTSVALRRLAHFVEHRLARYDIDRNDPTLESQSGLSPYLHFGQVSALQVALAVKERGGKSAKAFLEELIVRRELAMNFVYYNERYDSFESLHQWSKATLKKHERDRRAYAYSINKLEQARTHDPYWNAAQKEMMVTGKMHGYMRMYWGKKILEWTPRPEEAYARAVCLNDKYELDGRDPNGYAGVAWCFGKHDRPWGERGVFGTVRYMNDKGLMRKFDADAYVKKIEALMEQQRG